MVDKYEKKAKRLMRKTVGELLLGMAVHNEACAISLETVTTRDGKYLKPKERAALMASCKLMMKAVKFQRIIANHLDQ